MCLTLFVYGELNALAFDVSETDDDNDALCHLRTCVEEASPYFSGQSDAVMGLHVPITGNEFDVWVDTGNWSRIKEAKQKLYDLSQIDFEQAA
jgi:hypothetical protein